MAEKEKQIMEHTRSPHTRTSLAADLRRLGVTPGMTTIVHTAMSKLEWVCVGPVALIQALMDVVTQGREILSVWMVNRWVEFDDIDFDDESFPAIGAEYEKQGGEVRIDKVGNTECRLMPQRPIVDFTVRYIVKLGVRREH